MKKGRSIGLKTQNTTSPSPRISDMPALEKKESWKSIAGDRGIFMSGLKNIGANLCLNL
jgi:hypothetical protein